MHKQYWHINGRKNMGLICCLLSHKSLDKVSWPFKIVKENLCQGPNSPRKVIKEPTIVSQDLKIYDRVQIVHENYFRGQIYQENEYKSPREDYLLGILDTSLK